MIVDDDDGAISKPDIVTVTVQDTSNPTIATFLVDDVEQAEGDSGTRIFRFTITRGGDTNQIVTVDAVTANTSPVEAAAGTDYVAAGPLTLSFATNETSKTFDVTVNGDTAVESNEKFFVNLSNASNNAVISDAQGVGTITNDDAAQGSPTLSIADANGTEGGNVDFAVTLSQPSAQTVTVAFTATPGTASASDFSVTTQSPLNFPPNSTTQHIVVAAIDDSAAEGDETFTVTLSNPTNATLADANGTGTISANDQPTPPQGLPLCAPEAVPGIGGECLADNLPILGPLVQGLIDTIYNLLVGGNTPQPPQDNASCRQAAEGTPFEGDAANTFCDTIFPPPVTPTSCLANQNKLCVGSAKRSVAPSAKHIDGAEETHLYADLEGNVGTQRHKFGLGGYGLGDPTTLLNPTYPHIGNGFATGNYTKLEDDGNPHSTYVRAFVVEQAGKAPVAFVTLDAVGAGNIIQRNLKAAVTAATGIPADNILFGQTHSHSAGDLQGLWGGVPATWLDCDSSKFDLDGCGPRTTGPRACTSLPPRQLKRPTTFASLPR